MADRRSYVEHFREVTDLFKASIGDYCVSRYQEYAASKKLSYLDLIKTDIFKYGKSSTLSIDESTQKIDDIRLWLRLLNQNWELFMKPEDENETKIGGYCAAYLDKRLNTLLRYGHEISEREAFDLIEAIASLMEVIGPPEFVKTVNEHIDELWHSRLTVETPTETIEKVEVPFTPLPPKDLITPSRNGTSSQEYTLPYLDGDSEDDENTARLPLSGHGYLIEITYPDQQKEQICVEESPFMIGRNKRNHLVVKDRFASRYHVMLTCVRDQDVYVQDMNSINGTFLEGERMAANARVVWKVGQTIKVGETKLVLQADS